MLALRQDAPQQAPDDSLSLGQALSQGGDILNPTWYQQFAETAYAQFLQFLPGLIKAVFVLLLFWLIYRSINAVLRRTFQRSTRVSEALKQLLQRLVKLAFFALAMISALNQLGLNVNTLIAGLGIAGIAVGFAAKDSLENMIAGLTILLDVPFVIGDNLKIGDLFGTVTEITLRSTRIRTLNNEVAVIPNAAMINQTLVNHTMMNTLRVCIPFGIAYKEYPQEAREVVLALTENDSRLDPSFPPAVVVRTLNSSSVDLELRLWLRNPKEEIPVRLDYTERIREALRAADIEIPFPHLQLFIDEAKAFEGKTLPRPDAARS